MKNWVRFFIFKVIRNPNSEVRIPISSGCLDCPAHFRRCSLFTHCKLDILNCILILVF